MADNRAVQLQSAPEAPSEHIYIASEEPESAATRARTVTARHSVANPLRRARTELTLFAEGAVKVVEYRGDKKTDSYVLDLKYLDPVPQIDRVIARRAIRAALVLAGGAALCFGVAWLGLLPRIMSIAGAVCTVAALGATLAALYASYEKIVFETVHGRAAVLTLRANLGAIRQTRALIPVLAQAIDETADTIGSDTAAFLRAEMREHYRLRGDGVLTHDACSVSTGRILGQFDVQL